MSKPTYRELVFALESAEAKEATLRALLREAGEALKPFTHEDLTKILRTNSQGGESIVWGRDNAILKIKYFRRAAEVAAKIEEATK